MIKKLHKMVSPSSWSLLKAGSDLPATKRHTSGLLYSLGHLESVKVHSD